MKKLVLALFMTLCTLGALRAQSLQSDIMSYLRTEGYAPSYDSDGDIQFKKEGYLYYVIVKDIDDGYSYVEVRRAVRHFGHVAQRTAEHCLRAQHREVPLQMLGISR